MEINLEQVQNFIETNKDTEEVSNYLEQFEQLNVDKVESFLGSDEGRSLSDKLNNKFLSSYTKDGAGQSRAFESMLKAKREEWENEVGIKLTPEQQQIKDMQERLDRSDNDKLRAELTSKAINSLQYKDLGPMAHTFVGANEEETMANVTMLNDFFKVFVDTEVEKRMKGESGRTKIISNDKTEGNELVHKLESARKKAIESPSRENRINYKKLQSEYRAEQGGK